MRSIILIEKIKRGNRAEIVAVCASKRVAVKLILARLLDAGEISTSEIGAVRKFININEKTAGFSENFRLKLATQNQFFNL